MRKINVIFIVILLSAKTLEADCDQCKEFFFSFTEVEQNKIRSSKSATLALFCYKLTVGEVKAALKDIDMKDDELWKILSTTDDHHCKAEGCLYLREQMKKYYQPESDPQKRLRELRQDMSRTREADRYNSATSKLKRMIDSIFS